MLMTILSCSVQELDVITRSFEICMGFFFLLAVLGFF